MQENEGFWSEKEKEAERDATLFEVSYVSIVDAISDIHAIEKIAELHQWSLGRATAAYKKYLERKVWPRSERKSKEKKEITLCIHCAYKMTTVYGSSLCRSKDAPYTNYVLGTKEPHNINKNGQCPFYKNDGR